MKINLPETPKNAIYEALSEGLTEPTAKYMHKVFDHLWDLRPDNKFVLPVARRVVEIISREKDMPVVELANIIAINYEQNYRPYLADCRNTEDPEAEALARIAGDIMEAYKQTKKEKE